jgi:hypothetical protein
VLPALLPVEIHPETARVARGQEVVLTAVLSGCDERAMFFWYRGRIGEVTHPIQSSSDPNLKFIANEPGVSLIWVQAIAGSVTSSAAISVDVIQPRRRTVRR